MYSVCMTLTKNQPHNYFVCTTFAFCKKFSIWIVFFVSRLQTALFFAFVIQDRLKISIFVPV